MSLPTVGGSTGTWGTELNDWLLVDHNTDGTNIGGGGGGVGVFYAEDYGAVFDGILGTDNTDAINDTLAAAAAYNPGSSSIHGGIAQLPPGNARITGQLVVSEGVWLRGSGPGGTEIYADWGVGTPAADSAILVDGTNQACTLSDFSLYMTAGDYSTTAHGIEVMSGVAWGGFGGIFTEINRVLVRGLGYGVALAGLENRLRDVYAAHCGLDGFNVTGTDNFLTNCTADTCGLGSTAAGFLLSTSNSKLAVCKAFGCTGSGFNINGTRNMFSSCEAQDNGLYGFNDPQGGNVLSACIADTNGTGINPSYGFHLAGPSTATGCFTINRTGTPQDYGYSGGINSGYYTSFTGCTSYLPGTAHVDPATTGVVQVNNLLGAQPVAYASSITPDPYSGGTIIVGTLTGTITVNAVSSAGLFTGMPVSFQFTQDGTGRAVTFNSQYKTAAAISTTPSSVTRIKFEYDGSFFRETGRAVS